MSQKIFWKACLERCLEQIQNNKWNDTSGIRDILIIFRDEWNELIFPYVCVLGVYTVWLLVLMICNTLLLWYLCQNVNFTGRLTICN